MKSVSCAGFLSAVKVLDQALGPYLLGGENMGVTRKLKHSTW